MGKVLILDDDDESSFVAKRFLAAAQIEAIVTKSYIEANRLIFESPPDSIDMLLLDLHMPGTPVAKIVELYCRRGRVPRQPHMKVVLYSSESSDVLRSTASSWGADGFISKEHTSTLPQRVMNYIQGNDPNRTR